MQDMIKIIRELSYQHSTSKIFSDFVEVSAIALSNAVDKTHFEEREKRYLDIVKQYKKEEFNTFPQLLGMLVKHLDDSPQDVLGEIFHALELHNERKGQFFTPFPICQMMTKMIVGDNVQSIIDNKGFITLSEPCCGTGAMVIAAAVELHAEEVNYQQSMHDTTIDLDVTCIHAAYVQFSLLHIPAILIHGDTLTLKTYSQWHTPAHKMGFWRQKIERNKKEKDLIEFVTNLTKQEVVEPKIQKVSNQQTQPNLGRQLTIF